MFSRKRVRKNLRDVMVHFILACYADSIVDRHIKVEYINFVAFWVMTLVCRWLPILDRNLPPRAGQKLKAAGSFESS
jgi:hypothetical protein